MDNLNPQVLRGFGVKSRNVQRSKGRFIVQSDSGKKIIEKYGGSADDIAFHHAVKEGLVEKGFPYVDRFYTSVQGKPYYLLGYDHDAGIYTMTDYLDLPTLDFCDNEAFLALSAALGAFHKTSCVPTYTGNTPLGADGVAMFAEGAVKMAAVKKTVKAQSKLSDFDLLVLRNYDSFMDRIQQANNLLRQSAYGSLREKAVAKKTVCHNLLKKENLYWDGTNVHITNFVGCTVDYYIADVAQLVHRHVKYRKSETMNITEILEAYNKFNKISNDDMAVLHAFLLYPGAFVKICTQYYSKKRTFIPGAFTARMDHILEQRDNLDRVLQAF